MFDPTFSATNAHLADLDRAVSPRVTPFHGGSRKRAPRAGTVLAMSLIGVVATGLVAFQGLIA